MHYTLTPRGNATLMVVMVTVLFDCFLTGNGTSLVVIATFLLVGALAGLLQQIAICHHVSQFQSANTALQPGILDRAEPDKENTT